MSETLRSFRRNAVHVRQALPLLHEEARNLQMTGGYLEDEGIVDRYKRLSIPVRRALNPTDKASFAHALAALRERGGDIGTVEAAWTRLQAELDSTVVLGGSKVTRRTVLDSWLKAAAFYDSLERETSYTQVLDQYGKAAEGLSTGLTEEAARVILLLDEAAAGALGEPVILPPPTKTPPPPPDPKESWWKRWFGR